MTMKFRLYKENGALNSPPVFSAFEQGLKNCGLNVTEKNDGIPVIWSVLWRGRMMPNKAIYEQALKNNVPVIIIEVGNLLRGTTWRISINNVNTLGYFGNVLNLDQKRPEKLGINLQEFSRVRKPEILIAGQHEQSLQWDQPISIRHWVINYIKNLKHYTDRKILFRPHPRWPVRVDYPGLVTVRSRKIYRDSEGYDLDFNYHCIVNYNSGPGVQAAISGIPILCDSSSLAYSVSEKIENIENLSLPDRTEWLIALAHTEWTINEIQSGIPIKRLLPELEKRLS